MIGRDKQYFIAESTRTLDLIDNTKSEEEGDNLWFGCGTVDKSGRLCEKTIDLPPSLGSHPSLFTVQDLSQDPRFNELPFVSGPPNFRFYAGTPLTTKRGINIGSVFIIDDVVREPLNIDQEKFLGTIAQTIIGHMALASEAEERKKVMRLSLGMNAFVERKARALPEDIQSEAAPATKTINNFDSSPRKKMSRNGSTSTNNNDRSRHTVSPAKFRSVGRCEIRF